MSLKHGYLTVAKGREMQFHPRDKFLNNLVERPLEMHQLNSHRVTHAGSIFFIKFFYIIINSYLCTRCSLSTLFVSYTLIFKFKLNI